MELYHLPLPVTTCYIPVTTCHYLSLSATICHYLSLSSEQQRVYSVIHIPDSRTICKQQCIVDKKFSRVFTRMIHLVPRE
ncbi:hypothetical protein EB796_009197 [Bugula neritina]|uniref:Uncharacterized protein n=1 Tax=Bugula neritina TaxID=10212 RepID=A0A7J7K4T8_BUGNE|nr:hypothetical protein EB796_009197 [Bugula neritina]